MAIKSFSWIKKLSAHQGGQEEGVDGQGDHLGVHQGDGDPVIIKKTWKLLEFFGKVITYQLLFVMFYSFPDKKAQVNF